MKLLSRWKLWKRRQLAEEEEEAEGITLKQKLLGSDVCTEEAERFGSRTSGSGNSKGRSNTRDDAWSISNEFSVDNERGNDSELRDSTSSSERQEDGRMSPERVFVKRGSSRYHLQASEDSATEKVQDKHETVQKREIWKELEKLVGTPDVGGGEKERKNPVEQADTTEQKDPVQSIENAIHIEVREDVKSNDPFRESTEPSRHVEERSPSRASRRRSGRRQSGRAVYHDHDLLIADDAIEVAAMGEEINVKRSTLRSLFPGKRDFIDLTTDATASELPQETKERDTSNRKTLPDDGGGVATQQEEFPPTTRFVQLRRAFSDHDLTPTNKTPRIVANDSLVEDIMSLEPAEREWLKEYIMSRKNRSDMGSESRVPPGFRLHDQRQVEIERELTATKDEVPDVDQMSSMLSSQSSVGSTIESNSIRDEKIPDFKGVILAGNVVLPDGDDPARKVNSYLSSETEEDDIGFSSGSLSDGTSHSVSSASITSDEISPSGSESLSSFEEDIGIFESAQHLIGRIVQCKGI